MELSKSLQDDLLHTLTVDNDYTLFASRNILNYINKDNYLQIIYSYGESAIVHLVAYFEEEELYEECRVVKKAIFNYNKSTGKNLKLK